MKLYPQFRSSAPEPRAVVRRRGAVVHLEGVGEFPAHFGDGPPAKRGRIWEFSASSRRRLVSMVAATDPGARALFVTLTYRDYPPDGRRWKRDLATWWKRVLEKWPGASCVWKLEPQPGRYAPHYHLIVWGVGFMPKEWLAWAWADVTGDVSKEHIQAGTRVELVRSHRGVLAYAAKYLCHRCEARSREDVESGLSNGTLTQADLEAWERWQAAGRWWGVLGRARVPLVAEDVRSVPLYGPAVEVAKSVVRDVRNAHRSRLKRGLFGDDMVLTRCFVSPAEWAARVRAVAGDRARSLVAAGSLRLSQVSGWAGAVVLQLCGPRGSPSAG